MYGGHITDDWDRRLCRTYLSEYVREEMLAGEACLAPGFVIPPSLDYKVRKINLALCCGKPLLWINAHESEFPHANQGGMQGKKKLWSHGNMQNHCKNNSSGRAGKGKT